MDANICDINLLDADVLLPPRKRLLAGFKKQNFDLKGSSHMPSTSITSSEFDTRLNILLRSHLNNPNLSPEEIVEASRLAAEAAVKVAEAARAAAEEKAVIAAKAMAAAKSALALVANVSEETVDTEGYSRKNKMKKQVPVQLLYSNKSNCRTDEELARNLHRAINSSPRITKNSSTSDLKGHKYRRLKKLSSSKKVRISNGDLVRGGNSLMSNENGIRGEVDSLGAIREAYMIRVEENGSQFNKADRSKLEDREEVNVQSKEKNGEALEDTSSLSRKRGRMKQKKLPLSICNYRDQSNPKEDLKYRSSSLTEDNMGKATVENKALFSVGASGSSMMPVERTSLWKCKSFKAPACVEQNNVMQS